VSLNVIRDDGQEAEDADHLDQQLLAVIVLRLGGPLQESGHILGQLTLRRRCAVLVLNDLKRGTSIIILQSNFVLLYLHHRFFSFLN